MPDGGGLFRLYEELNLRQNVCDYTEKLNLARNLGKSHKKKIRGGQERLASYFFYENQVVIFFIKEQGECRGDRKLQRHL